MTGSTPGPSLPDGTTLLAEAGIAAKLFPRSNPYVTNAVAMPVGTAELFPELIIQWIDRGSPLGW